MLLGFCIATLVGPVGLLCIRRTLVSGTKAGILSGIGAACADSLYGFVAAFGLSAVSGFLIRYRSVFRFAGGIFLCCFGITMAYRRHDGKETDDRPSSERLVLSTFALTASNPLTVVSFMAVFSGLGIHPACPFVLVAGIFLGSVLWWCLLAKATSLFRTRMSPEVFRWVDGVSGGLIAGAGIAFIVASLRAML